MIPSLSSIASSIRKSIPPVGMITKIIAIDGGGGAGKSTLASNLSEELGHCPIIHTDDFASWENSQNWYPRMIEQVLGPLKQNKVARFQRYDWNKNELSDWLTVEPQEFVILEGVTSARKEFRPFLSFSLFVDTNAEVRLRRGLERDGPEAKDQWLKWMREEDEYLARDNPKSFVNVVTSGEANLPGSEVRKSNYFVLTGTPGTGKTTLLQHLRTQGFHGNDEVTREVLSHQLEIDGPGLPSKNPLLFVQMMLERSIEQFESSRAHKGPVFFDRGIPDLVAYAIRFGVDASHFEAMSRHYGYNQTVFICEPWKEIFVNDNERKITFEKSVEFHDLICETYKRLDFKLIKVPKLTPTERVNFILQQVSSDK